MDPAIFTCKPQYFPPFTAKRGLFDKFYSERIIYLVFNPADCLRNFCQVGTALLRHKKLQTVFHVKHLLLLRSVANAVAVTIQLVSRETFKIKHLKLFHVKQSGSHIKIIRPNNHKANLAIWQYGLRSNTKLNSLNSKQTLTTTLR